MKVLYLDHPESDNLTALVYMGLCEELGAENVVDWPWQPTFHGQTFQGPIPTNPNGVAAPFPWLPPTSTQPWSDQDVFTRIGEFDLVVLASPRAYNTQRAEMLIKRVRRERLRRFVMMDGEDYTTVRWDFVEKLKPSVYFKVSLVNNAREMYTTPKKHVMAQGFCRVVPFSMATTVTGLEPKPKDIDVCLLGGGNWRGPAREGVAENRGLLKPVYEQKLRTRFGETHKLVLGNVPYADYIDTLVRTRVAVTLGGHGVEPVRSYDTLAAPGTLLVRAANDHISAAPLTHGVNCATFVSLEHMLEMVGYYLEHEEERAAIAKQGNLLVAEHYTPRALAKRLLRESFA